MVPVSFQYGVYDAAPLNVIRDSGRERDHRFAVWRGHDRDPISGHQQFPRDAGAGLRLGRNRDH